ncbi:GMC family oxidoreductase [Bordetella sp. BOR01]|uniref:GMC family oxidoreductase n=1 Tax=Bordetella sp. BOR01 TaxID=2854779 RepID=UPI001C4900A6|nr:GMC family oxidoreductase N-terminal domain-containing protein [Bordetella sp. BOR01]MBV7483788.1 GMC family oxidoreductase N-terminal domain-containing protein [Bordetella sp. BOR01]
MYVKSVPHDSEFDFIVCGAGSAGCVVAEKLSADASNRVLLVEAGGRDRNVNIRVPLLVVNLINNQAVTWPYLTEPQLHLNGKPQRWTRGRVIGGSGAINGNLFARGDPAEYDNWRELGCQGWGYADMLPVFKRLEDFPPGDPDLRGRGGPIHCTRLDKFDPLSEAFVAACGQAGYRYLNDYNDGSYEGAFFLQYSTRRGLRDNTAAAYLKPARKRRNLTILTGAVVARVLMDGRRAAGIEIIQDGARLALRARKEVVLSAGPLATPQILELSGVGNEAVLAAHGIPVVHHLPGVGENLRDHPNTRLTFECARPITINDVLRSPRRKLREGLRFLLRRNGLLSISSSTAQMNLRSSAEARQADLVLRLQPLSGGDRYARTPGTGMDMFSGFTFGVTILQPASTGTVHIQSADPLRQARMDPCYLSRDEDARLFLRGMRIARQVAAMPALQPLIVRETRPGPDAANDAAMLAYLRETLQTSWHMVGTCKMGVDDMAVVDPDLRVRGIGNLRVIDSSICPTLPSSGTNIPTIAIAEKGAERLLAAHQA